MEVLFAMGDHSLGKMDQNVMLSYADDTQPNISVLVHHRINSKTFYLFLNLCIALPFIYLTWLVFSICLQVPQDRPTPTFILMLMMSGLKGMGRRLSSIAP